MTYISNDGEIIDTSDWEYPPMSGTRIVHECYSDSALYVRIQYAEQTFRSGRREQTLVVPMRDTNWDHQDVMDAIHYSIGTRSLI